MPGLFYARFYLILYLIFYLLFTLLLPVVIIWGKEVKDHFLLKNVFIFAMSKGR